MEQQYNEYNLENQQQVKPEFSMKWHKFLISFSLWAGAVIAVVNAAILLICAHEGGDAKVIYEIYKREKPVAVLFGLLMLACGVAYIVARFKLARLERAGVKMLIALPIIMVVLKIAYRPLVSFVTGVSMGEMLDFFGISSIVGTVFLAVYNKKYYTEREALLVD